MLPTLRIGAHATTITFSSAGDAPVVASFPIGTETIASLHFQRIPPTPANIEAAIETVEDALMPIIPRLHGHESLHTADAESIALLAVVSVANGRGDTLDLERVEHEFSRLVDAAFGSAPVPAEYPLRASFAANLLILRELIHHAGVATVSVATTQSACTGH